MLLCAPRAAGEHEFRLWCDALVQSRLLLSVPCLQSIPGPRTARRASTPAASAKRSGSDHVDRALFASHGFARAYWRMAAKTWTLATCKTLAYEAKRHRRARVYFQRLAADAEAARQARLERLKAEAKAAEEAGALGLKKGEAD